MDDVLARQIKFAADFDGWVQSYLADTLEDNRRRYRMILEDEEERTSRGLSCLPSTKSCSAVDRAVEKAIMEYHGDPDAISYTARMGLGVEADKKARWLSEIFKYRSQRTFPFAVWHVSSLTAGFADGLECAMLSWRREAYKDKQPAWYALTPEGEQEIPQEAYEEAFALYPDMVREDEKDIETVVTDTWWIDQLRPGEDVLWDVKAPLMNLNMGSACLVKVEKSVDELLGMADQGIIDKTDRDELEEWLKPSEDSDTDKTAGSTRTVDLGSLNRACLWIYFEKVDCRWKVSFSIEGKHALSKQKDVNDLWYNGRKVNRLPVIIGTAKMKLWENVGRGLPETIAPVEDEWTAHRNNLNDAAKIEIQGRFRVNKNADIDLDQLLNGRVFFAKQGDYEKVENNFNLLSSLRAAESVQADMQELVPVGMESRQIVPKGTDKTLGALEMALANTNEKLGVSLLVRNLTFMRPLLEILGEMMIAFESDETVLKAAGAAVREFQVPMAGEQIDLKALDFGFDVQINAGLGSVPRQHKIQIINALLQSGAAAGLPVDALKGFRQASVLSGYDEDYFLLPEDQRQKPPAPPEMKATINVDLALLPPQMQQMVMQAFLSGSQEVTASVKGDMPKPDLRIPQEPRMAMPVGGGMTSDGRNI